MPMPQKQYYTADEFFNLTNESNERVELRDGEIVAMASPSVLHQKLVMSISATIYNYIQSNNGKCEVYPAPFDVKLDDYNIVIPDISVICDKSKVDDKRCNGSPDWIIEIVSSNWKDDYIRKLGLYEKFGVLEYWIVDPSKHTTFVYFFENSKITGFYDFSKTIPVGIYKDNPVKLEINIANLLNI